MGEPLGGHTARDGKVANGGKTGGTRRKTNTESYRSDKLSSFDQRLSRYESVDVRKTEGSKHLLYCHVRYTPKSLSNKMDCQYCNALRKYYYSMPGRILIQVSLFAIYNDVNQ